MKKTTRSIAVGLLGCALSASALGQVIPIPRSLAPAPEALRAPAPTRATLAERGVTMAGNVVSVRDVKYGSATLTDGSTVDLTFDVAYPAQVDGKLPCVVYIHGGGWNSGSKRDAALFMPVFARGGYVSIAVGYRLAPAAGYPAAVHDCKAAIRFIRANADGLGIDPDRIGIWGHSAGAQLAALVATSANEQCADGAHLEGTVGGHDCTSCVKCCVGVSGPMDLAVLGGASEQAIGLASGWLGGETKEEMLERARVASPSTWLDKADPPLLVVHGTADALVPPGQSQRFHQAAIKAGVQSELVLVPDAGHVVMEGSVYARVAEFLDHHLGGNVKPGVEAFFAMMERFGGPPKPPATP